jgi:deoxyribonucleoside regulator
VDNYRNKIQLLVKVARMYYLEDKNQSDIAQILGVSRPLVSKYLSDARELGIVKVHIHDLLSEDTDLLRQIVEKYKITGGLIVPSSNNEDINNQLLIDKTTEFLLSEISSGFRVGVGWGSTIGGVAERISNLPTSLKLSGEIIAMIGNAPTSNRNYHTNELVRMLSEKTGLRPEYFYAPIYCYSESEKEFFTSVESYKEIYRKWQDLDCAIVNIRNHPSVPDLATAARFGNLLQEKEAVGLIMGYYFDKDGNIITSDRDYIMQIPWDILKKTKKVIAIASGRVNPMAIAGALNTGIITHLIIDDVAAKHLCER